MDVGTDTVLDLGGSGGNESDVVVIESNATLTATGIAGFTATSDTTNKSTGAANATLTAKADAEVKIDVSGAKADSKGFTLEGGSGTGNDILTGGGGVDIITGGAQIDTIKGNGGADTIAGGAGNDIITGGGGNDIITVDVGTDKVLDLGGSGGNELSLIHI